MNQLFNESICESSIAIELKHTLKVYKQCIVLMPVISKRLNNNSLKFPSKNGNDRKGKVIHSNVTLSMG